MEPAILCLLKGRVGSAYTRAQPRIFNSTLETWSFRTTESFCPQLLEALNHGTLESWLFEIKTLRSRLDSEVSSGIL